MNRAVFLLGISAFAKMKSKGRNFNHFMLNKQDTFTKSINGTLINEYFFRKNILLIKLIKPKIIRRWAEVQ